MKELLEVRNLGVAFGAKQVVHGVADYGGRFCCALGRDNLFATQFHPEKSGQIGLEILKRFATWDGSPC